MAYPFWSNECADKVAFREKDFELWNEYTWGEPADALQAGVDSVDLVVSEVVRYQSFDDLEISGILYKPKSATDGSLVPGLIWVHGGPGGQSSPSYNQMIQHLVNHGYAGFAAKTGARRVTEKRSFIWTTRDTAKLISTVSFMLVITSQASSGQLASE